MIRAAVLTISDSVCRGTRQDLSGPAVRKRLEELGWEVVLAEAVPDEAAAISERLRRASDSRRVDAIFTTGGTGVAHRDVTPEATRAILDREIPGLTERMRAEGGRSTPLAALSRAVAGTRGATLIVNLPGSPQGARESLDVIVDLVPHLVELLGGRTGHAGGAKRNPAT